MGQTLRFIAVGVLNTIVGYTVYFIAMKLLGLNYIIALMIAHIIGVLHSYVWNSKWVFRKNTNLTMTFKFSSVYLITFLINLVLLYCLITIFSLNELLSQAIAMVLTTIISFLGHKFWSFNK